MEKKVYLYNRVRVRCGGSGFSWQITPRRLMELTTGSDRDQAQRAMEAMFPMRKIGIATIEKAAKRS